MQAGTLSFGKEKFDLLIFDFDGTVADSKHGIEKTVNRTLELNGFAKAPEKQVHSLIGLPLEEYFPRLLPHASGSQIEKLISDYREEYKKIAVESTSLFPEMKQVLEELRERGAVLAVATSKRKASLELMVRHLELEGFFKATVCADEVRGKKPDPESVEMILEKTGFEKKQALMIGDSVYDVQMGKAAGVKTCAVSWGAERAEELEKEKPDFLVHDAKALLEFAKAKPQ